MKHLKQEFDKLSFKDTLSYTILILCLIAAFVLLFCGMFIPPEGEIHDSVLTAFGIILLFVASILGLDIRYGYKLYTLKGELDRYVEGLKGDERKKEDPPE